MKYPWMPLFWGDFLANTMHLSAQEAGAYLFLIAHAWEHDGKIPVDRLKRVSRISNYNWPKIRAVLMQFFDTHSESNFWISQRVKEELIHAGKLSNKRKDAALQMHSKRKASASILHMHPQPQPKNPPLPPEQMQGSRASAPDGARARPVSSEMSVELQMAKKQHLGISPDQGMDYRSPSPKRSEHQHELQPLPDRQK